MLQNSCLNGADQIRQDETDGISPTVRGSTPFLCRLHIFRPLPAYSASNLDKSDRYDLGEGKDIDDKKIGGFSLRALQIENSTAQRTEEPLRSCAYDRRSPRDNAFPNSSAIAANGSVCAPALGITTISEAGAIAVLWTRKNSRKSRFMRFLTTALPKRRVTVIPKRDLPVLAGDNTITK
jgi:hypothetical protein